MIDKEPELLTQAEILQLFMEDCLRPATDTRKLAPWAAIDKLLDKYCEFLGVVKPHATVAGRALQAKFPKIKISGKTGYLLSINPDIIQQGEKT